MGSWLLLLNKLTFNNLFLYLLRNIYKLDSGGLSCPFIGVTHGCQGLGFRLAWLPFRVCSYEECSFQICLFAWFCLASGPSDKYINLVLSLPLVGFELPFLYHFRLKNRETESRCHPSQFHPVRDRRQAMSAMMNFQSWTSRMANLLLVLILARRKFFFSHV